ncbi:hypothetical protein O181_019554 [Austropuccinia psidii MF-1]|uniref:Uncharacterized protein n=1 Tax=Austropuccinia psidii MF-1 TaxID=1389203 RepID=A0A9Q3C9R8_9BASI|nr:hypothetical protein [Austropuccinia psidii MF-1]
MPPSDFNLPCHNKDDGPLRSHDLLRNPAASKVVLDPEEPQPKIARFTRPTCQCPSSLRGFKLHTCQQYSPPSHQRTLVSPSNSNSNRPLHLSSSNKEQ